MCANSLSHFFFIPSPSSIHLLHVPVVMVLFAPKDIPPRHYLMPTALCNQVATCPSGLGPEKRNPDHLDPNTIYVISPLFWHTLYLKHNFLSQDQKAMFSPDFKCHGDFEVSFIKSVKQGFKIISLHMNAPSPIASEASLPLLPNWIVLATWMQSIDYK